MKLTTKQLREIIKEELQKLMETDWIKSRYDGGYGGPIGRGDSATYKDTFNLRGKSSPPKTLRGDRSYSDSGSQEAPEVSGADKEKQENQKAKNIAWFNRLATSGADGVTKEGEAVKIEFKARVRKWMLQHAYTLKINNETGKLELKYREKGADKEVDLDKIDDLFAVGEQGQLRWWLKNNGLL
jgi:hypothetical protein